MSYALNLSNGAYLNSGENNYSISGENDFTLEAWVNTSSEGVILSQFVRRRGVYPEDDINVFIFGIAENGQIIFNIEQTFQSLKIDTDTTSVNNGKWHFLCGVRQNNDLRVYIDGLLINSTLSSQFRIIAEAANEIKGDDFFPFLTEGSLSIGKDLSKNNFTGKLSEIRIWSKALSQQEILNQMDIPLKGNEPDLVAYYTFSNQDGTDSSPYHLHLSAFGNVQYTSPGAVLENTEINIPANTAIIMSAKVFSDNFEKVTINVFGYNEITFLGSGLGVDMKTPDNLKALTLNSGNTTNLTLNFSYSVSGTQGQFSRYSALTPVIVEKDKNLTITVKANHDNPLGYVVFTINWSIP